MSPVLLVAAIATTLVANAVAYLLGHVLSPRPLYSWQRIDIVLLFPVATACMGLLATLICTLLRANTALCRFLFYLVSACTAEEQYLLWYDARNLDMVGVIPLLLMPALAIVSWWFLTVLWEVGFRGRPQER